MSQWFANLLKNARSDAEQSIEAMALMVNVSPEEYEEYEAGRTPPEESIIRICQLLQWNYNEIMQGIRSQASIAKDRGISTVFPAENAEETSGLKIKADSTLGKLMREERKAVNATSESVALLLNITIDDLAKIEQDEKVPDEALLKKIAMVFKWNHNDLFQLIKKNSIAGMDFSSKSPVLSMEPEKVQKIKSLCREIAQGSERTKAPLLIIEAQLDLILSTVRKFQ